ncbi:hypothetical protein [Kocuria rosea]|uniref:LPXTG cell wall anchor domain-containing protein n=1 Tax=Kocuria rosea TaxID=1275 RepID=A0A4R5YTT1_KOCRO|nr:hypothetical protein [Kocuria rosea]TDL46787.1 hypothetical protein E2R59_01905 [Kocuria rosea]
MTLRPLALAALLLLAPVPGAAHAAETAPPPAPGAESPAGVPSPAPPSDDEPADHRPGTGPAEAPDTTSEPGGAPAPEPGGTAPDAHPSPAPGGHAAPEPGGVRAEDGHAGDARAGDARAGDGGAGNDRAGGDSAGDARTEAAPGTPSDADSDSGSDPGELSALERASFVGPGPAEAHRTGSGALVRDGSALRAQVLAGQQQVTPGTLTRISVGTVTRVPAQDATGDSSTVWWVGGLAALGAAAAGAVVARGSRARRPH